MKGIKVWFLETRPQFLILSVVLAFLGASIARYDGHFVLWQAVLAGVGLVFTHASVNILNDYFDYRSGVDLATRRTPFSGGSGILPANLLTERQVLWLGIVFLILAVPIGVYFVIERGWQLLPLLLVAAFFIVLYSPFILKRPWPEWVAGAGLGTLPILGMYFSRPGPIPGTPSSPPSLPASSSITCCCSTSSRTPRRIPAPTARPCPSPSVKGTPPSFTRR